MNFWKTDEFHKVKGKRKRTFYCRINDFVNSTKLNLIISVLGQIILRFLQMRTFSCVSNFVQHLILEHTQFNRDVTIPNKFLIFITQIFPEYLFIKIRILNYTVVPKSDVPKNDTFLKFSRNSAEIRA